MSHRSQWSQRRPAPCRMPVASSSPERQPTQQLGTSVDQGFSLIELVVTVAIIAIIAAIAYPSYAASIYKSRRVEGRVLLETAAAAEERYYVSRNKYTSSLGNDGLAIASTSQPGGFYTLAAVSLGENAQTFTLVAQPQAAQSSDACGSLTLESSGRHGAQSRDGSANDSCW